MFHVHRDSQFVAAAADENAAQRSHVSVVTSPGRRDVTSGWEKIIGGININPAVLAAPDRRPCVRSVAANEFRFSGRWQGLEIATDVPSRETDGTQAGDHHLGKVLANSTADSKEILDRGHDSRCLG